MFDFNPYRFNIATFMVTTTMKRKFIRYINNGSQLRTLVSDCII